MAEPIREWIRNDATGEEYKISRADFDRINKGDEGFYFMSDKQVAEADLPPVETPADEPAKIAAPKGKGK